MTSIPQAGRDPIQEARWQAYLLAAAQTELLWAMLSNNQEAMRVGQNVTMALTTRWPQIADLIWGTVNPFPPAPVPH